MIFAENQQHLSSSSFLFLSFAYLALLARNMSIYLLKRDSHEVKISDKKGKHKV